MEDRVAPIYVQQNQLQHCVELQAKIVSFHLTVMEQTELVLRFLPFLDVWPKIVPPHSTAPTAAKVIQYVSR